MEMDVIPVYKCFCDTQRLRILNLLSRGPLCVCHLMEILDVDQVKMSKQLQYMKKLGMLEVERVAQWRIYRIVDSPSPLLEENLRCLQDFAGEDLNFAGDLRRREEVLNRSESDVLKACCVAV